MAYESLWHMWRISGMSAPGVRIAVAHVAYQRQERIWRTNRNGACHPPRVLPSLALLAGVECPLCAMHREVFLLLNGTKDSPHL